jgi:enoyl-CoA hydratase
LPVEQALKSEWENSIDTLKAEGVAGATRFKSGKGRHGEFDEI